MFGSECPASHEGSGNWTRSRCAGTSGNRDHPRKGGKRVSTTGEPRHARDRAGVGWSAGLGTRGCARRSARRRRALGLARFLADALAVAALLVLVVPGDDPDARAQLAVLRVRGELRTARTIVATRASTTIAGALATPGTARAGLAGAAAALGLGRAGSWDLTSRTGVAASRTQALKTGSPALSPSGVATAAHLSGWPFSSCLGFSASLMTSAPPTRSMAAVTRAGEETLRSACGAAGCSASACGAAAVGCSAVAVSATAVGSAATGVSATTASAAGVSSVVAVPAGSAAGPSRPAGCRHGEGRSARRRRRGGGVRRPGWRRRLRAGAATALTDGSGLTGSAIPGIFGPTAGFSVSGMTFGVGLTETRSFGPLSASPACASDAASATGVWAADVSGAAASGAGASAAAASGAAASGAAASGAAASGAAASGAAASGAAASGAAASGAAASGAAASGSSSDLRSSGLRGSGLGRSSVGGSLRSRGGMGGVSEAAASAAGASSVTVSGTATSSVGVSVTAGASATGSGAAASVLTLEPFVSACALSSARTEASGEAGSATAGLLSSDSESPSGRCPRPSSRQANRQSLGAAYRRCGYSRMHVAIW